MGTRGRRRLLGGAIVVALVVPLACSDGDRGTGDPAAGLDPGSAPAGAAPPTSVDRGDDDDEARATRVATVPGIPTGLVAAPDGSELLVSTHDGVVHRVALRRTGDLVAPAREVDVALDLRGDTRADARAGGLLNLALDRTGRWLLTLRTTTSDELRLERAPYQPGEPIREGDVEVVWSVHHPFVHSGGGLALTTGGDLLVGAGAVSIPGEPPGPQQPDGVVLRIPAEHLDGTAGRFELGASDLVARGLRNPWRVAFDADEERVWIADVGEDQVEEIDVVVLGPGAEVPNFGWPHLEGSTPYVEPVPDAALTPPHHAYGREEGRCAVTGGHVVRGGPVRSLDGAYLFGDYCGPEVWALPADGRRAEPRLVARIDEQVVGFGRGPAGETYVMGGSGAVVRLDPPSWDVPGVEEGPVGAPELAVPRDLGPAGCRIIAAIAGAATAEEMAPSELRAAVERLVEVTRTEAASLPDWLAADGRYLAATYASVAEVAAEEGWDPTAPAVRRRIRLLQAERGPHPSALRAEFSFLDHAASCP